MGRMDKFGEAYSQLNAAQRRAVDQIEGPVLVIAGPGTGKTQLLTTRIANILGKTDAAAANILCLTFTESAAQTMRERLTQLIGQAAYDVTISTYHAFGSDLIRRFPDYFSEFADTQPIDDLGSDSLLREIVASLPYSNPLKFADNYLGDIKTLISDAKRALLTPEDLHTIAKQNLAFIKQASPIVAECLGTIERLSKKDIPAFEKLLTELAPLVKKQSAKTTVTPLSRLMIEELQTAVEQAQELGKQTPLTTWKNAWLVKDGANQFVADGAKANQKLVAAADMYASYLQHLAEQKLFDYDDMILRAVHALDANADLRYTLQEQYLYILLDEFQDTNGAQLRLVELLTDNPVHEGRPNVLAVGDDDQAIYAFQGANYSHMLQFQKMYRDVLLVPLTANYRSHTDILQVARGVAEQIDERLHYHFPTIEKTLTAENKKLPARAVVERREAKSDVSQFAWTAQKISQLIADGMPASDIAVLAPKHKYLEPLVAFLHQAGVAVQYEKRENVLDDRAINQLLRMSELCLALTHGQDAAANNLWPEILSFAFWELPTSLIWELSWQASDNEGNWSRTVLEQPDLKPIALFFKRLGLLSKIETIETIFDYLIGVQPLDLGEKTGTHQFRSPFFAFYFGDLSPGSPLVGAPGEATRKLVALPIVEPESQSFEIASSKVGLPRVNASLRVASPGAPEAEISPSVGFAASSSFTRERPFARGESTFEPVVSKDQSSGSTLGGVSLSRVKDDARQPEVLQGARQKQGQNANGFWDLLTNLIVLRSRLREYKADQPTALTLEDLLEFVKAHRAANIKILNTSPYREAAEAVQLLTAFKAKGQEYAAVFVLAVNDEAWGSKARTQGSRLSIPPNLQFIRYAGATNDERLRLFYVAITRAKSQLYLVNYTRTYAGRTLSRLKYLSETTDEQGELVSPLLSGKRQKILPAENDAVAPTTELAAYWQQRHQNALGQADITALLRARLERFQLSPTHVNDFIDLKNCGPQAFFLKTILRFPQAPLPQVQFGNAMHETLEWIHLFNRREGHTPDQNLVLHTFEQRLKAKRLNEQDTALLLTRGREALRAYCKLRMHTIAADNECEYNFRNENVFVGAAHLGGKIDKLIIDKTAKTITIVDYKTGQAHVRWSREIKLHKYEQQLYFYKLLVEGSRQFAGYRVTDAYVEFVEPNEAGEIVELHTAFDDTKTKRLEQLIQTIWERITQLNLPDTAGYDPTLGGIEAFEQDLLH